MQLSDKHRQTLPNVLTTLPHRPQCGLTFEGAVTRPATNIPNPLHAFGPMGGLEGDDVGASIPRRIMVVDDNADAAQALVLLIGTEGHEVQMASDGRQALELADAFKPELILLDISMPGLNGYEIARCLQQRPWAQCLTLVAVSGWGEPEDKQRAVAAGFSCYLVKPVASDEVMAVINGLPLPGGRD